MCLTIVKLLKQVNNATQGKDRFRVGARQSGRKKVQCMLSKNFKKFTRFLFANGEKNVSANDNFFNSP
jgi:hypothetical protein